jgi:hypothetical protein
LRVARSLSAVEVGTAELSAAEYRKLRKEITDRIAVSQRRVVIRPMALLDGLTGMRAHGPPGTSRR